jgi:hypothetical protein
MALIGIILILLGLLVLAYGSRLAIFAAGVGALLGIWLLNIIPGAQTGLLSWVIPLGLAVLFSFGAGIANTVVNLVTLVIGALAGFAIVNGVLDLFGIDWGFVNWILAIIGAVVGAGLIARVKDWAIIILASLVGALLCTRGLQLMIPSFTGFLASLVTLVLLAGGVAYQGGFFGKKKTTS